MTKSILTGLVAALFAATSLYGQATLSTPKLELQLCYGLGTGGLQSKESTTMQLSGGVGVGVALNFNEHWGIISGADFALYYGNYKADVLYCRESVTPSGKTEPVVITNKLEGYNEVQILDLLQIPVMLKYMTPLGSSNHKIYVAAGTRIGIPVLKQAQQSARVSYDLDDKDDYNFAVIAEGFSEGRVMNTRINMAVCLEGGVRFRFNNLLGLYAGLFCDYGLYNPCRPSGTPVYVNNPERAGSDPLATGDRTFSVLEASNTSTTLPIDNSGRFISSAHTFIIGAKARLYFGLINK